MKCKGYSLQQDGRSNSKKLSTLWKDQLSPKQPLFSGAHVGKLFKPSTLEVRSDRVTECARNWLQQRENLSMMDLKEEGKLKYGWNLRTYTHISLA